MICPTSEDAAVSTEDFDVNSHEVLARDISDYIGNNPDIYILWGKYPIKGIYRCYSR